MADDPLKEQHERAVGDQFFEWFNAQTGTNYVFVRRSGEAPDLVYTFGARTLLVETTDAFCESGHARFIWQGVRNTDKAPECWIGINADQALAQAVAARVTEKCLKRYGGTCLLLVNVPPGVTAAEALAKLLASCIVPEGIFAGIYVVGRFPITSHSNGGYCVIPLKEYVHS